MFFFFSSRRRHTRFDCDWSSDVCSSDLFGRGKSCVQLLTLHTRPFTVGSNTIQYVVFIHSFGTPRVELTQDFPPSSLRKRDRKSTRLNSSHSQISYAVFCLKKKKKL